MHRWIARIFIEIDCFRQLHMNRVLLYQLARKGRMNIPPSIPLLIGIPERITPSRHLHEYCFELVFCMMCRRQVCILYSCNTFVKKAISPFTTNRLHIASFFFKNSGTGTCPLKNGISSLSQSLSTTSPSKADSSPRNI